MVRLLSPPGEPIIEKAEGTGPIAEICQDEVDAGGRWNLRQSSTTIYEG